MTAEYREKGFSLIELLVAITLLTIGMLAVGSMLQISSGHFRKSAQDRAGEAVAMEIMEALKVKAENTPGKFAKLADLVAAINLEKVEKLIPGSTTRYQYKGASSTLSGGLGEGQGFVYEWSVQDKGTSWPNNTAQLTVTVGWNNCSGADPNSCHYTSQRSTIILYKPDPK